MSTTKATIARSAEAVGIKAGWRIDWPTMLVVLLRAIASVCILRGLGHWSLIIGLVDIEGVGFEDLAPGFQALTVFLAVIELVAGVGLWLGATWGVVCWLIAVGLILLVDGLVAVGGFAWLENATRSWIATAADIALVTVYGAVATLAARQADELPPDE